MDDIRVKAFRSLKPPCVELSQVALRFQAKKATARDIVNALGSLLDTLREVTKQDHALDSKLAEYAFFPLSHVLRRSKDVPIRALELALQCLQILISRGWRRTIASDLAKQLLILLTFLAGGSTTEAKSKDVNEELGAAAYACLASLFRVSDTAGLSVRGSIDATNFPVLGHSVSVLLDGLSNGPSTKVRLTASSALDTLVSSIPDKEALRNFFPGIVSSLTKLLSTNASKGPFRIFQGSIQILNKVLLKVVCDNNLDIPEISASDNVEPDKALEIHGIGIKKSPWLEATSSQVKLALANIVPLRYHDRDEVRLALFRLCISVMGRCQRSLNLSIPMMLETSVIICTQSSNGDEVELLDNLTIAMIENTGLLDVLKSTLRDWLIALPRIMQSNDDISRKRSVGKITTAFKIISTQGGTLDTLDDEVANNLRASVSAAIQASAVKTIQSVPESGTEISQIFRSSSALRETASYAGVLFNQFSQKTTIAGLEALVSQINSLHSPSKLRRNIVDSLGTTFKDEQLASFWLSLQLLQRPESTTYDFDWLTEKPSNQQDDQALLLDDVYGFSLTVLSKPAYDSDIDWRLQALSLQAVTLQARQQKTDFRPELVDALYPILERLGSSNAALQHHAITALSLVSKACNYPSPRELVIENVDYLVNNIALKLNTFDISPQAPQVLVMMLRLCGARLIPYLDDLVESIFTILEYYHGYPKLVESMFLVLSTLVEEGNKDCTLAITEQAQPVCRVQVYQPVSITELASQLREARLKKPPLDPLPADPEPEVEGEPNSEPPPPEKPPPPLSKSLQTITSIATLTQHHLPTSSPSLRLLLLRLLPSAFAPLSHHQDTLLPLVNSLWPVLIARLYDPEPYVCIAACQALSSLCRTAGDFMASRFDDEWEKTLSLYGKAEREMLVERKAMGRGGVKQRVWEAVAALVGAVVEWVGLSGEMEDVVWDVYEGSLEKRHREDLTELRGVLEGLNADALWFLEERARLRAGGEALERPVCEGVEFAELAL